LGYLTNLKTKINLNYIGLGKMCFSVLGMEKDMQVVIITVALLIATTTIIRLQKTNNTNK
jgi:hypothetical protein